MGSTKTRRPKAEGVFYFDRDKCKKCGRFRRLQEENHNYSITASIENNRKQIELLKRVQTELIERGSLNAEDVFVEAGHRDIKLSELLPTQHALEHPDKFCFTAHNDVRGVPILVGKIGYLRHGRAELAHVADKYVIMTAIRALR